MSDRYFLGHDQSCHWYLVPAARRAEWEKWSNIPEDDEASWDEPAWAKRIGGDPACVTFTDPIDN